ncbi:HemK2/MTQ2 family protein methyltransferase [Halomarina oriensis]|uniref:Methyltransferase domain-containing protein n=1 Tax=Halomarina oriensis TaxID=671145 RepID=A0A6B0GLZ5_9EURY|nr:HemK2/MTQ2 family protein methyltransferase [Halomarina oriensis]MWG35670.1 methyltransferase domain-containing protein [Halomarina oriensis]
MVDRETATEQVYQPAEDSHLLAETAAEELAALPGDARVVDVGTGSGYVAAHVGEQTGLDVLGVDISPLAVREARDHGVGVVRSNLLDGLTGPFDAVTFNPPYLPTDPDAEWDDWMEYALSGGPDGRRAIDPFLDDLPRVLAPDGRAFLLVSSLTDVGAVTARAAENGLAAREVAEESFPFERLVVLELAHAE